LALREAKNGASGGTKGRIRSIYWGKRGKKLGPKEAKPAKRDECRREALLAEGGRLLGLWHSLSEVEAAGEKKHLRTLRREKCKRTKKELSVGRERVEKGIWR